MAQIISTILSNMGTVMTTLFNEGTAADGVPVLATMAMLPVVGGVIARVVSVVRAGRG